MLNLNTAYQNETPEVVIINNLINNFRERYGVTFYKHYTRGRKLDNEIEKHIVNIIETYGQTLFDEVFYDIR